jgi:transcriptional regulator with XRE-family HTH domain
MQEARKAAGLSRAEIAEKVEATEAAVRLWETSQREPRTKYLRRWAEATGRPISWFFEEVPA